MKIAVIGIVGLPASYGGFETLVENIIHDERARFTVYCSARNYTSRPREYRGAKLVYIPLSANGVSSILYDVSSLIHAVLSGHKNFLVLGVSGALLFPFLKVLPKIKVVTNIDGIEWRRQKWSGFARLFLRFSEYLAVKFSDVVISDNDAITEYVTTQYKLSCRTIAYGGDHAVRPLAGAMRIENLSSQDFALSICRIEPENNVHLILEAFSCAKVPIVFIGNWENSDYGMNLHSKYSGHSNVVLLNPIYCLDTLHAYRSSCSIYVHGHSAGGTNPSLIEMMHFSKPIIAYDCAFNRASMENKGNYFNSTETLSKLLEATELLQDGDLLKEIAQRRYTWERVRELYLELFEA